MDLRDLRPFYEQVTPERLEAYLAEHGWSYSTVLLTDVAVAGKWTMNVPSGWWWRKGEDCVGVPNPFDLLRTATTVDSVAEVEQRQPTAVLYDLLPVTSRRAFVLALFPQLAEALPEELP